MRSSRSKKNSKPWLRLVIYGLSTAVVLVGVLFALERKDVTNFYGPSTGTEAINSSETVQKEQDIDMSPASTTDNEEINKQKEEGTVGAQPKPEESNASVTITRASQNSSKSLVVGSIVSGLNSGSCTLILEQGSEVIQKTSNVVNQGSYFGCDGFVVPINEFTKEGEWLVKLSVSYSGKTVSDTTKTTVSK